MKRLETKKEQEKAIAKELNLIIEEMTVAAYIEGCCKAANSLQKTKTK